MEAGDRSLKSRTVTRGWKKALRKAQITRWGIQIHSPRNSIHQGVSFICSNFQRLKPPPLWWMKCFLEVSSVLHWGHCIPLCSLCLFHRLSFPSIPPHCLVDSEIRIHYTQDQQIQSKHVTWSKASHGDIELHESYWSAKTQYKRSNEKKLKCW